jgi:hypothetical protein
MMKQLVAVNGTLTNCLPHQIIQQPVADPISTFGNQLCQDELKN